MESLSVQMDTSSLPDGVEGGLATESTASLPTNDIEVLCAALKMEPNCGDVNKLDL